MTRLALLRHGATEWTQRRLVQGRRDIPLSEAGRAALRGRVLPAECRGMRVVTSPLTRCVQTAALVAGEAAAREPRIIEMDWGEWEGRTLADLRAELGAAMQENEDRGLDFRPHGGESPREVLVRVREWLRELEAPTLAVTHRGVIRVVLAAATGWDMTGKPPAKLDWGAVQLFTLAGGNPRVERLNAG